MYSNICGYIASAYDGKRRMLSENSENSARSGAVMREKQTVSILTVGCDGKTLSTLFLKDLLLFTVMPPFSVDVSFPYNYIINQNKSPAVMFSKRLFTLFYIFTS